MRLASVRLRRVGPFDDVTLRFGDDAPRAVTVVFGADGMGKTTLLSALALTRPGYALPPLPSTVRENVGSPGQAPFVAAEWLLGDDDPERPHPLLVTSPNAVLENETPDLTLARRREQALFDRRAQVDGGFVFVAFSGARWFSRASNMLSGPDRTLLRYDVKHPASFDDPTRADLTRETKQVLAYAAIARALGQDRAEYTNLVRFDEAVREVVDVLLAPFGFTYAGVSPTTLEPEAKRGSRVVPFEALPRPAKHLVAFGALTLRALFAAYPNAEDPREGEGVVVIDDIEGQQDPTLLRAIGPLLCSALPGVQWILTTASTQLALACTAGEVLALRRSETAAIEIGEELLQ